MRLRSPVAKPRAENAVVSVAIPTLRVFATLSSRSESALRLAIAGSGGPGGGWSVGLGCLEESAVLMMRNVPSRYEDRARAAIVLADYTGGHARFTLNGQP